MWQNWLPAPHAQNWFTHELQCSSVPAIFLRVGLRVRFLQTAERSHMPAREVNNVRKHSDDLSREASGMERPSSARLPAPGSQLFFFFSMSQVATDQEAVVAVDSGATISCELPCLGLGQPLQRNPFFFSACLASGLERIPLYRRRSGASHRVQLTNPPPPRPRIRSLRVRESAALRSSRTPRAPSGSGGSWEGRRGSHGSRGLGVDPWMR